jgi:hypothetical protein
VGSPAGRAVEEGNAWCEVQLAAEDLDDPDGDPKWYADDERQQGPSRRWGGSAPVAPQGGDDERKHDQGEGHHDGVAEPVVELFVGQDHEDVLHAVGIAAHVDPVPDEEELVQCPGDRQRVRKADDDPIEPAAQVSRGECQQQLDEDAHADLLGDARQGPDQRVGNEHERADPHGREGDEDQLPKAPVGLARQAHEQDHQPEHARERVAELLERRDRRVPVVAER